MPNFSPPDNVDEGLPLHRSIRQRLPNTWNAFFARFERLRSVQKAAVPKILKGNNVLVTGPTAGGKTEAVAAPLCERLKANWWAGMLAVPTLSSCLRSLG
jgi:superfamily II DNA/RNA helicase